MTEPQKYLIPNMQVVRPQDLARMIEQSEIPVLIIPPAAQATEQQLSDAFLKSVRQAYSSAEPMLAEILAEQQQMLIFWTMCRAGIEVQPRTSELTEYLAMLNRTIALLEKSAGVLGTHYGIAMSVNAVMREHED